MFSLPACRARQDGSHQLGGGLVVECSLAPEFVIDIRRQRNIGDDQLSWGRGVGRDLLFDNAAELAHAAPFIGSG